MTGYPRFFQSPELHRKALWGTLVIAFFSVLPLLALPLIDNLRRTVYGPPAPINCIPGDPKPIALWDTISSGQLFMYSFAFFGSLLWMLLQEYKSDKTIPNKLGFASILCVVCFYCMIVYSISPDLRHVLPDWVIISSIGCFATFLGIHYVLLVYPELPVTPLHDNLNKGAKALASALDAAGENKNG